VISVGVDDIATVDMALAIAAVKSPELVQIARSRGPSRPRVRLWVRIWARIIRWAFAGPAANGVRGRQSRDGPHEGRAPMDPSRVQLARPAVNEQVDAEEK